MIRLRFLKSGGVYNRGEVASFAEAEAERLIAQGFAEDVAAAEAAAKAEAEAAAKAEAEAAAKAEAKAAAKAKS